MTTAKRILWVLASPDPQSLNRALFDDGVDHLRRHGHVVDTVDLHAEGWNPVLSDDDHRGASGDTLTERQRVATHECRLPADVRRQQELILSADLVIVQFPLWWYGMPAILKGWFDRVFTNGFAFGVRDDDGKIRKYGDGGLVGRRLLPIVTAGDRSESLGPRGISGDITDLLWPLLHGTAHYTGMSPLRPHLVSSVHHMQADGYELRRDDLRRRLDDAGTEAPLAYRHLRGGDYTEWHELRNDIAPHTIGFAAHVCGR
ncbi:NAD(P)H-dependent oxidoreductase [Gordonia sp. CPCC 206044]|uniref:NAD(P)H-dependent oxidoreductase n=1 Tax=Gordonia sp. CPCC 206044 TaxID=3140793 RepID=UPI003AF3F7FD